MEIPTDYDTAMAALDEDLARQAQLLNPEYQNNLYMIESALRDAGAIPRATDAYPNVYDEQLLQLIDAVTME